MATSRLSVVAVAAIFLATLSVVSAQAPTMSPAEAPAAMGPVALDCFTVLLNVSDCLTYVEMGSNLTKPDKGCCPALAGLVESNPICLCELIGKTDSFGVQLDLSKALNLPTLCGVTTPPLSLCPADGSPVESPVESPVGNPNPGYETLPPGALPGGGGSAANNKRRSGGFALAFFVTLSFTFF